MPKLWMMILLVAAIQVPTIVRAGLFDPPDPKIFARKEDRLRARLFRVPCTEADVGRGCQRSGSRMWREAPCTYATGANMIGRLPTEECYRMDKARRFSGIWIDEFEGQKFILEGMMPPEWPRTNPGSPGWKKAAERAQAASIWLDASRVKLGHSYSGHKRRIEFIGRKTRYTGSYGHMGLSGNEIIVDRLISVEDVAE